ncbi:MAG: hypothetical protein LBI42_02385 [Chitinispirillales bacterium]|jgi:hypothetical protein|nr:hypothetical protein [Chitinispirillales bacterium]
MWRRGYAGKKIWTLHEKLKVGAKAIEEKKKGNIAEYERISKSIPMTPYLAKFAKEYLSAEFLIKSGWNLSEAEAEYGPGWLNN